MLLVVLLQPLMVNWATGQGLVDARSRNNDKGGRRWDRLERQY